MSGSKSPAVIELGPRDGQASLGYRLDSVPNGRLVLVVPWDIPFLSRGLDFELLGREARRRNLEVAVVSADPERRQLARGSGFAAFPTVEAARARERWKEPGPERVAPPPKPWWKPEIDLHRERKRKWPAWLVWMGQGVRLGVFITVSMVLAATAYTIVPQADVTLVPTGTTVATGVRVAVDPEADGVQIMGSGGPVAGIVPARRVGLEIEGTAEVEASGTTTVAAGRAKGEVLFTSLLAQDYVVPAGTIVRTSSTSYPIRFRTTTDVVVPADGQRTVSIEALDDRTGNVGALQINQVEGIAGSAVRVINPEATSGAEPTEVRVVTQDDYDRVRDRLTQELLNEAHYDLHSLLEPREFLPRQSLRVESVPKKAYSRFVGERADMVSLNLRLLVSGQAVDAGDVEGVAYEILVQELPGGQRLIDAEFEMGAVREDEDAPGWFTVGVSGRGYASAAIDTDEVARRIRGQRIPEARETLLREYSLAEAPQFIVWPEWPDWLPWLERAPLLTIRTNVTVAPAGTLAAAES